jgi:hypothetical protein
MDQWNSLMQALGTRLGPYAPRVLGAAALLALTWLLARIVRASVQRLAASRGLDERLKSPGLAALLSQVLYWLVWLVALPAVLGALELEGLLTPVNAMMARLLGVLPGVMGAAAIFGIGFLAARILRQLVTGLLTAAGSERLAARIGLGTAMGDQTLASIGGSAVFALVLLPTLAASLQALGLEAIARPVGHLLDMVVDLIPKLVSAGLIVTIGAVLGRMLASLVAALLGGLGMNNLPARLGLADNFKLAGRSLSELVGGVIMGAALLLAVTQACEVIGFNVLTEAVAQLGGVLAKLVVAAVILGVGLWVATAAARVVEASEVVNARVLAQATRVAILFFTLALALRQAGLPADIITLTFGSAVCGVALAVAIAVGVGGRHVAARLLESAVASFQAKKRNADTEAR